MYKPAEGTICSVGLAEAEVDDAVVDFEELTTMLLLTLVDDESFEDVELRGEEYIDEVDILEEELTTEVDGELRIELVETTDDEVFTDELELLVAVEDFEDEAELMGTELE